MDVTEIIDYLNHKRTLNNPSPNRFKKPAKDFLLKFRIDKKIETEDLKALFYMYIGNMVSQPKCQLGGCTEFARFITFRRGFSIGCSHKHAKQASNIKQFGTKTPFESIDVQDKVKATFMEKYGEHSPVNSEQYKKTCIERYGFDHPMKSDHIKQKLLDVMTVEYGGIGAASPIILDQMKQTNIEKYSCEYTFQSEEIKSKIKHTNMCRRGVEYPMQSGVVKEKAKQTNLDRYGVENPMYSEVFKEKIKQTNFDRHGFEFPMQSEVIREKAKQTNLDRYGVENPMQSTEIQQKLVENTKEKYGVTNFSYVHLINLEKWDDAGFINEKFVDHNDYYLNIEGFCEYFNCNITTVYRRIKELGIDYKKNKVISKMEMELFESIEYTNKFQSNKTILGGKELDIYIPEKNLAIEFNGTYWHSELNGKDKKYHLNKTLGCAEKNIQLIHIFESEWIEKKKIVLSILNAKLGIFDNRIFARKCNIKDISSRIKNAFLNENHLQGSDKSSIKLGLFYNGELVTVMTFGKSRYNKKYQYEMYRFCSKQGYQVIGGASKLWSYFRKKYNPESVITYADVRYSNGLFYEKIGFTKINISQPNYFYFKCNSHLISRIQFQKHKLKEKLEKFNSDLTEWENMQLNGYDRIWDCGNYVFGWYTS